MGNKDYFRRVRGETPTRFWINNPTLAQARQAIEAGASGCTTNPSYVSKLFASPDDFASVKRTIDALLPYEPDDSVVAAKTQALMVGRLSDEFMPLYRSSGGKEGFVTIQGDPYAETEARKIIEEGAENRKLGENVIVKIPVTTSGIEAIEYFVKHDVPTMATEVMGLSQAVSICEAYRKASAESGKAPVFYVTHITGILDDFFKQVVKEKNLAVSPEALAVAGISVAKREYELLKERGYPGQLMGGGARKLEDFTELVGGELSITVNWTGTADALIERDAPVVSRIGVKPEAKLIEELAAKLPGFSEAYEIDGMSPAEYYDYGGVELFRNSFMRGWKELLDLVAERRRTL